MYTYIYVYICVFAYAQMYMYTYIYVYDYTYVYLYLGTCIYIDIYISCKIANAIIYIFQYSSGIQRSARLPSVRPKPGIGSLQKTGALVHHGHVGIPVRLGVVRGS